MLTKLATFIKAVTQRCFLKVLFFFLTLKSLGGQFDLPCSFCKIVSRERMKLWYFVTVNIIVSHIFPENFIKILQVVQKI